MPISARSHLKDKITDSKLGDVAALVTINMAGNGQASHAWKEA